MKRTSEFVLGLLGGIFGFGGASFAIFFGAVDKAVSNANSTISGQGWLAFLMSILAIVGCIVVKSKPKVGGWMMLISAIVGLIAISFFYAVPAILLFIAGLMGIIRKAKPENISA